ncbi:hypothetical protein OAM49_00275 [bacterium]|nr:hypothetical protein [bacterium]
MVDTSKAACLFYRKKVSYLLNNTQYALISARIFTDRTHFIFGKITTCPARLQVFFYSPNAFCKLNGFFVWHFKNVVGESLSAFFPNTWKAGKSINQPTDW